MAVGTWSFGEIAVREAARLLSEGKSAVPAPSCASLSRISCGKQDTTRKLEPLAVPFLMPTALETTQGQNDSFFSQLPYKCYLHKVAFVGE